LHQLVADPDAFDEVGIAGFLDSGDVDKHVRTALPPA
jgi:hypothetical protein